MRKPKIIVSECLNSGKCRYDGSGYEDKIISLLKEYVDIETVCPETAIGLTTPRDPLRIESINNEDRIIQPKTSKDYTLLMTEFSKDFLGDIKDIDGFILKSRSPSCGFKDVKIYPKDKKCAVRKNGSGIFADTASKIFSEYPMENEGRLKNYNIRDEFLTKIFTINDLKCENTIRDFHKKNSVLLSSYDNKSFTKLCEIISKTDLTEEDIKIYKAEVYKIMSHNRSSRSKALTCKCIFEKYKPLLPQKEIDYFEKLLASYNKNRIPFNSIVVALQMYAVRFNDENMISQSFFSPYPEDLMSVTDSGKGRSI